MIEANGIAPPGWYPDPSGSGRRRWWNGLAWTAAIQDSEMLLGPASGAVLQPAVSSSTALNPWPVWGMALMPFASLLQLVLIDWPTVLTAIARAAAADAPLTEPPPGMLLVEVIGVVALGLTIAFAVIDWWMLRQRGIVRPFLWAWVFLSPLVYLIGRAVVLNRRTRRSARGPVWTYVLSSVVAGVAPSVYLSHVLLQILPAALSGGIAS